MVNVTVSSLVTQTPEQVLTRHFTQLTVAAQEISDSRFYGGVSFYLYPTSSFLEM